MPTDLEQILAEHGRSIDRVASLYSGPDNREDLLQDIIVAIWTALPRFRGDSSLRTYLFRIAHNRGVRFLARQARSVEHARGQAITFAPGDRRASALPSDRQAVELVDQRPDPESHAIARQQAQRLFAAVNSLPLGQRQVLSLQLEGLAQREIADVLGIHEPNVAVRLHRARAGLHRLLEESDE